MTPTNNDTADNSQENSENKQDQNPHTDKPHHDGVIKPLVELIEEDLEKIHTEFPLSGAETEEDLKKSTNS